MLSVSLLSQNGVLLAKVTSSKCNSTKRPRLFQASLVSAAIYLHLLVPQTVVVSREVLSVSLPPNEVFPASEGCSVLYAT